MPPERFADALNAQVANEFAAHQQYLAIAVHYDGRTMPRLAAFFYRQALEERDHGLMMVRYLMDIGARPHLLGVGAPQTDFTDDVAPIALALEQEREVSDQVAHLAAIAREGGDYPGEQFMQWFIKEQVEEVASMSALLDVAERSREMPMLIEEYLAREHPTAATEDPSAPPVAGGSA
jgi:ferritin